MHPHISSCQWVIFNFQRIGSSFTCFTLLCICAFTQLDEAEFLHFYKSLDQLHMQEKLSGCSCCFVVVLLDFPLIILIQLIWLKGVSLHLKETSYVQPSPQSYLPVVVTSERIPILFSFHSTYQLPRSPRQSLIYFFDSED